MKTVIGIILVALALAIAAYFALPFLINKETQELRKALADLKQRIQKVEAFMDKEEKVAKDAQVKADAGLPQVIKTLNALSNKVVSLEDNLKTESVKKEEWFSKQKALLDDSFKKQNEILEKTNKDQQEKMQRMSLEILVGRIREQILKFKEEVTNKNIGLAKNEFKILLETTEKLKVSAGQEKVKSINEFQDLIKKASADLDSDLPAAVNRMELLWHEINKLLIK